MINRYSRQVIFPGIGEKGQTKLADSQVVVIGCGALGTVIASCLVRAGIGKTRIVDRDFIEYHNLQRQILFDEEDIREQLPKAIAAERHLKRINSEVEIEGIVADVNYTNIEKFISGADLIIDGLDNFETRLLINDASLKHRIPWIYGGAISTYGMTMNIIPSETACFRCLSPSAAGGMMTQTCDTAGVINPAPLIIGAWQSAEALKMLVGSPDVSRDLITIDVWNGTFHRLKVTPRPACPACQGNYEFLEGHVGLKTVALCGQNEVQILNPEAPAILLKELARRLEPVVAEVKYNDFMLRFRVDDHEMIVFPDSRAILRETTDESLARGLYSKYIGM